MQIRGKKTQQNSAIIQSIHPHLKMYKEWLHKWAKAWKGLMMIKKSDWKLACVLPLVEEEGKWCCMFFSSCLITFCHNYSKCNHSPLPMHSNLLFPWELWADGCQPFTNTCLSLHKLMLKFLPTCWENIGNLEKLKPLTVKFSIHPCLYETL